MWPKANDTKLTSRVNVYLSVVDGDVLKIEIWLLRNDKGR